MQEIELNLIQKTLHACMYKLYKIYIISVSEKLSNRNQNSTYDKNDNRRPGPWHLHEQLMFFSLSSFRPLLVKLYETNVIGVV